MPPARVSGRHTDGAKRAKRGRDARRDYSKSTRMSPPWTGEPTWTGTDLTVPATGAVISVSIFIASRMMRVSPGDRRAQRVLAATAAGCFASGSRRTGARHRRRPGGGEDEPAQGGLGLGFDVDEHVVFDPVNGHLESHGRSLSVAGQCDRVCVKVWEAWMLERPILAHELVWL